MEFRKLKKKLAAWDIEWDKSVGSGSHGAFVGLSHVSKQRRVYPLPKSQQKTVDKKYINPLRRQFELTQDDGVTHEEFYS